MKNRSFILAFLMFFLTGCVNTALQDKGANDIATYKNMTVDELNQQLNNKDFALVDVHIPEQDHINGTDAFIPYDEIEKNLDKLPQDKNAKIVLYCRTGRMSEIAAQKLAEKGYTNIYNVAGGKVEWDKKGYE